MPQILYRSSPYFLSAPLLRLIFLFLIAGSEIVLVSWSIDAHALLDSPVPTIAWLGYSGLSARLGFLFVAILGFLNREQIKTTGLSFWRTQPNNSLWWLAAHALSLAIFGLVTFVLFTDQNTFAINPSRPLAAIGLPVAWLISGCASQACLLLVFWPWSAWRVFLHQPWQHLPLALLATAASWGIALLSANSWTQLSRLTFILSKALLSLVYHSVVADPVTQALGTPTFIVAVRPECSGYEGMALVTLFFTLFIWTARKVLRFPVALLLYPMGIAVLYLMNLVRICVLIVIGTEWSPYIALGGFHSSAGWVLFITVSVGIVWISQRLPIFIRAPFPPPHESTASNPATPYLLPFVVLMGSTLFGNLFSDGFDYIYPLKVVIVLVVLWSLRYAYQKVFNGLSIAAVIIGILVFIIWIALAPVDAKQDLRFAYTLTTLPVAWQYGWLFFRVIGATLTVPVVEELAFRGYLMRKLTNTDFLAVKPGHCSWLSFAASSVLFGAMHGAWLAGTLAGIGYALALYRRGVVGDAIIAHSTTNALLAIYVWQTQHWSLW